MLVHHYGFISKSFPSIFNNTRSRCIAFLYWVSEVVNFALVCKVIDIYGEMFMTENIYKEYM